MRDEIYTFKDGTCLASERRLLLCVDNTKFPEGKLKHDAPIIPMTFWIAKVGKGRNYCAFGHGDEIYVSWSCSTTWRASSTHGHLTADDSPTGVAPFATQEAPKEAPKKRWRGHRSKALLTIFHTGREAAGMRSPVFFNQVFSPQRGKKSCVSLFHAA